MLGLDVYNGSTAGLTNFRTRSTVSFPLLRSASGTGFSREDLVVVGPDGTVAFSGRSLNSSTVRSNAIAKVNELLAQIPPPVPAISVQQTAVDFGTIDAGQTGEQTITITNTGTASLNITGIQSDVSGLTFDTTMFTLAPDGSQTVTIKFPSSTEGTFSGTITISSNDPNSATSTLSVSIIVQSPPVPAISVQQTAVDFGTIDAGQRQLRLRFRVRRRVHFLVLSRFQVMTRIVQQAHYPFLSQFNRPPRQRSLCSKQQLISVLLRLPNRFSRRL